MHPDDLNHKSPNDLTPLHVFILSAVYGTGIAILGTALAAAIHYLRTGSL